MSASYRTTGATLTRRMDLGNETPSDRLPVEEVFVVRASELNELGLITKTKDFTKKIYMLLPYISFDPSAVRQKNLRIKMVIIISKQRTSLRKSSSRLGNQKK